MISLADNTIESLRRYFVRKLSLFYPVSDVQVLERWAFEYVFGLKPHELHLEGRRKVSESEIVRMVEIIKRLQSGEPAAYVFGKVDFLDTVLHVTPAVLIPRPETEELCKIIIEENNFTEGATILDIGTGSGCIAIALKKKNPRAEVMAWDCSMQALEVAKENAAHNHCEIIFEQVDIFSPPSYVWQYKLDMIVSNPPYIPWWERDCLDKSVVNFEPSEALFVEGDNPIVYYQTILEIARKILKRQGKIYFEMYDKYAMQILQHIDNNLFCDVMMRKDLSGKPRFIVATKL